jgi:HK97 family phage portal protein
MWPFKPKQSTREIKSAVLGLNDTLSSLLIFGSKNGETPASALKLYNDSSAVSIPINKIGDAFAGLRPVLVTNGEIERDHPVLDLLNDPSPYFTKNLFFENLAKDYLVTNEAHIVGLGAINRPPLELQTISPANLTISEGSGGVPSSLVVNGQTLTGSYLPDTRKRKVRYYDGGLRELYYIRGYSTRDNSLLRGQSLLLSASAEVRQHILGGTHNVTLLEKGGRMSLVFNFDADMTQDDVTAIRQKIEKQYGGAENAGSIGVTGGGGKLQIEELSKSNRDMDFAQLQTMAKLAIAAQYKIPLSLVTTDAQTLDNYKQANMAFYDDAVLPLADRIFGGLSIFLLPRFGVDPAKTQITYDIDGITALATRRNEELKLRKELAIESDNELRAMIGREDYEGGDLIYKPANLVPVGNDIFKDDPEILRDSDDDERNGN